AGETTADLRRTFYNDFQEEYQGRTVDLLVVREVEGETLQVYVNGALLATGTDGLGSAPGWGGDVIGPYLHIGNATTLPWPGRIAAAVVFNYALTQEDAQELTLYG